MLRHKKHIFLKVIQARHGVEIIKLSSSNQFRLNGTEMSSKGGNKLSLRNF